MVKTNEVKKEEKKEVCHQQLGGVLIILFSAFALCLAFTGFYFKFYDYDSDDSSSDIAEIEGNNNNVVIKDTKDIDADNIFVNMYYEALNMFSTTIGHGTTWLEVCPDSQEKIGDDVYFKVCDSRFDSKQSIIEYFNKYFTEEYIDELMNDNYIIYDGELYITPITVQTNKDYQGLSSYTVKSVTSDKIIYVVKSKYSSNDKDFTYQEHKFILTNIGGKWLVSNFEMPY